MKPTDPIDPLAVKIGRLKRKVEHLVYRLSQSRALNEHYKAVMNVNPIIDYRFNKYSEMKAERERIKGLETRIKEQAALIELLQKRSTDDAKYLLAIQNARDQLYVSIGPEQDFTPYQSVESAYNILTAALKDLK